MLLSRCSFVSDDEPRLGRNSVQKWNILKEFEHQQKQKKKRECCLSHKFCQFLIYIEPK